MGTKAVSKKKAKKSTGSGPAKKADGVRDVAATRDVVTNVIAKQAEKMTEAIAAEAEKGHLQTFRYLLELRGIYSAKVVEEPEAEDSNDLARVLLNGFDFAYKGPAAEEQEGATKDEAAEDAGLIPAGASKNSVD